MDAHERRSAQRARLPHRKNSDSKLLPKSLDLLLSMSGNGDRVNGDQLMTPSHFNNGTATICLENVLMTDTAIVKNRGSVLVAHDLMTDHTKDGKKQVQLV